MRKPALILILSTLITVWPAVRAQAAASANAPDYPLFLLKLPNPNDYTLFANAGWDGNWYVGSDTCWIKRIPQATAGSYARAFIGAKLGRMKLKPAGKKPWEQQAIPGEIFMALASTPSWNKNQFRLLTKTDDIPFDGDPQNAVTGVGESQWFWTEVPVGELNPSGPNYLALWSPTPGFVSVSSSPIVAAAWGGRDVDSWIARGLAGAPPTDPDKALATGISYFQPAMGIKLIPAGVSKPVAVRLVSWQNTTADHPFPVATAAIEGDSIERAWVEYSQDGRHWMRTGRSCWQAPYSFSVDTQQLPKGRLWLRVAAVNLWEEQGASQPFQVEVSIAHDAHR